MSRLLVLLLVVSLAGCTFETAPQPLPELRDEALSARDEAQAARDQHDGERAFEAADRAKTAHVAATKLLETISEPSEADRKLVAETQAAASQAQQLARRAEEAERLDDLTTGLRGKAYYAARGVALQVVFKGLSLAARQAHQRGIEQLPKQVQDSAHLAARLAGEFTERSPQPDGNPDWASIADDLDAFSADPPQELGVLAALGGFVLQQPRLAVLEIERVDPSKIKSEQHAKGYRLLRALILAQQDMPLSAIEILQTDNLTGHALSEQETTAHLGAVHLLIAYVHLKQGDYRAADLELVRSIRAWPDNPATIFLTGEQLAASGEYEQAADSLEKFAAGTEHEWLAAKIAARARELRDERGAAQPLLTDTTFVSEFVLHSVVETAKQSEAAAKAQSSIETARQFGQRMLKQIPSWGESTDD